MKAQNHNRSRNEKARPTTPGEEEKVNLYTIGYTKSSAQDFFARLKDKGVRRVIDVRLNNTSQLAGFTKMGDLSYFLREICHADYEHAPLLAPTKELLEAWKNRHIDWAEYENHYNALLATRRPDRAMSREQLRQACLLCSEPTPDHCHRRLAAEYLAIMHGNIQITHL